MVHKQLVVTVVLDCCHSGSAALQGALCRGIAKIDATILPSDKLPGLTQGVFSTSRSSNVPKKQSWLLEGEGYEIFAACRQNEKAYETRYPNTEGWHGALTYCMLDALNAQRKITHGMLHQKILDSIQNGHPHDESTEPQIPVFAGNPERFFFQTETTQHSFVSPLVMETSNRHSKAQFSNQQCQDVVHASGYSTLLPYQKLTPIYALCKIRYRVHQREALDRIYAVDWKQFSRGIAPLVLKRSSYTSISESREDNHDGFSVVVNNDGWYELWTGNGAAMEMVPNFVPCKDPNIFLGRVACLAQYRIVKNLKSPDHTSLSGKLSFRVKDPRFNGASETTVHVEDGDEITVIFKNHSNQSVNLTIFDLQPLYGIAKIYPEEMDCEEVGPGDERVLQLEFTRPPGIISRTFVDMIKAFVTVDGISFRDLEMEDIGINPDTESAVGRRGGVGLQALFDHLFAAHRQGWAQSSCKGVWETMEISVFVSGFENMDGEEVAAQKILESLSTVIATGKRDLFILPPPNPTIFDKVTEAADIVFDRTMPQWVRRYIENQRSPAQRNVMWRCRCGKSFTGVIPLDLAETYQSYQATSRTAVQFSGQYSSSYRPQNLGIEGAPDLNASNASLMSGDFVYVCVKTGGRHPELAYVVLPSSAEGRYDDQFFRHLRETYSTIRGARNVRNVTSFKFVKFQRSHRHYVFCYEEEVLPLMNEGYSYEVASPPLRQDEMVHFFNSPQCIQGSTACIRRIPKKVGGVEQVYGWGLYVQENTTIASILVPFIISVLGLFTAYAAFYLHVLYYDSVLTRWGI